MEKNFDYMPDDSDENDALSEGEFRIGGLMGLISGYYILSGTVVLFLILRPLKIIQPILDALGSFRVAGLVLLAIAALFLNVVVMGLLILNAERVKHLFE